MIEALATSPWPSIAYTVWEPLATPAGIVTVAVTEPLAGTVVGLSVLVSTVPVFWSSRRKDTAWPGTRLVRLALSVAGRLVTVLDEEQLRPGVWTVTDELWGLSVPVHAPWTGVTV